MIPRPETATPVSLTRYDPGEWSSRRAYDVARWRFATEHRGALLDDLVDLDAERRHHEQVRKARIVVLSHEETRALRHRYEHGRSGLVDEVLRHRYEHGQVPR